MFLIIYVSDEVSYDRYHENADRIYRVSSKITEPDDQFTWDVAQVPMTPQVVQDYPEVQSYVRFIPMPRAFYKFEDKEYIEENFQHADSTLFDIFTYKVLKSEITQGSAGSLFRKILVVIQFTISVAMIVCTLVVFRQP